MCNFSRCKHFSTFCCCCPLRCGCIFIGVFTLLFVVFAAVAYEWNFVHLPIVETKDEYRPEYLEDYEKQCLWWGKLGLLIAFVVSIISSFLVIIGAWRKSPPLLRIYVLLMFYTLLIFLISAILHAIVLPGNLIATLPVFFVGVYFWFCVHSYHQILH